MDLGARLMLAAVDLLAAARDDAREWRAFFAAWREVRRRKREGETLAECIRGPEPVAPPEPVDSVYHASGGSHPLAKWPPGFKERMQRLADESVARRLH